MTKKDIIKILNDCERGFKDNEKCKKYLENIKYLLRCYEDEEKIEGIEEVFDEINNKLIESKLGVTSKDIEDNLSKILEALKIWVDINKKERNKFVSTSFRRNRNFTWFIIIVFTLVVATLALVICDICGVFPYGDELSMALDGIGLVTSLIFFTYERISDSNEKKCHTKNLQEVKKQTEHIVLKIVNVNPVGDTTENFTIYGDVVVNYWCDYYKKNPSFLTDSTIQNRIITSAISLNTSKDFDASENFINDDVIDKLGETLLKQQLRQEEIVPVSVAIDGLLKSYKKNDFSLNKNIRLQKSGARLLRLVVYRDALSNIFNSILLRNIQSFDEVKEYREKLVEVTDITTETLLQFERNLLEILSFDTNAARNKAYVKLGQKQKEFQNIINNPCVNQYFDSLSNTFNLILSRIKQTFDETEDYRNKLVELTGITTKTLLQFERELLEILSFDTNVARNKAYTKLNDFINDNK